MNQLTARAAFTPQQLDLVQRTVAADTNPLEFDLFIEVARQLRLNPFRRQIYAVVYSKADPLKRKMSIIVGIDGYRSVANDCGDYRPSDTPPEFETDKELRSSENPQGIVKATVRVWKFGPDRVWYPVIGEARWDEFAPIKEANPDSDYEWIDTGEVYGEGHKKAGKPKMVRQRKQGKEARREPDGKWKTMPFLMLAKCAEAQALRRGWPQLSGVYVAEEMDRANLEDLTASEQAESARIEKRLERIAGKDAILLQLQADKPLELVPIGKFADMVCGRVVVSKTKREANAFLETNNKALQEFWARQPGDSLAMKKEIEEVIASLPENEATQ